MLAASASVMLIHESDIHIQETVRRKQLIPKGLVYDWEGKVNVVGESIDPSVGISGLCVSARRGT
jgi:hypothetical protein